MNSTTHTVTDAAAAVAQLETWRANGFYPELQTTPDGWTLLIRTHAWHVYHDDGVTMQEREKRLVFTTGWHPTIAKAVQAAREVIR